MLYHLLVSLIPQFSVFNVARYITFRTAAASMTALVISLVMGPWLIRRLRDFQIGQVIRQEGPESHRAKAGTPTMGGLLILAAALDPDAAVGRSDQRLRVDRRDHDGGRSAASASSTTTSRSRAAPRAVWRRATSSGCKCWSARPSAWS